nr:hypothetical protein [Tanacetum cinerariifolium]
MLQLLAAVDKFCGFTISCLIIGTPSTQGILRILMISLRLILLALWCDFLFMGYTFIWFTRDALMHDTAPRVTSPVAVEGTQEVEINKLKERVKILEDNQGVISARSTDDAPIKGRRIDEEEGGINVPTGSYSIPTAGPPAVDIHTGSDAVPTASPIVANATVVTPYSKRKGKEVMVKSDTPKKQRLQEQIDA